MDKKLNIAFFNYTQGALERGAEVFVTEVSKRLKNKYQVTIISNHRKLPPRWPFIWRVYFDPQGIGILNFTFRNLFKVLQEKYDVIVPLNGGWQSALLRVTTWLYGGKVVISGQSGKGWDDRNNLWNFPDCFVALSSSLKKWAKKVNPWVKVAYIPNGVDLSEFKPAGEKIHFDLEKPIIICVGALTGEKRIHLAIEAISKMRKGSLVMVGDGPLKERLSNLGKRLLGDRFLITKSDYKDLPKYYRGADIFTLPSPSYRSFEIVIVEAMATNLPVVVNNDPIRKEIVGDAGLLVDPENTNSYVQQLEKALSINWGNKSRKQAEKFSWDKIAKEYEKLFKELME